MATRVISASVVYASEAARDAASGWDEGDVVYVTGVGYTYYDGSAWEAMGGGGGGSSIVYTADATVRAQVDATSEGVVVRIFDEAGEPLTVSSFGLTGAVSLSGPLAGDRSGNVQLGADGSAHIVSGQNGIDIEADGEIVVTAGDSNVTMTLQADGEFEINGAQFIEGKTTGLFLHLPASDPTVAGALWDDTGTVKVSAG